MRLEKKDRKKNQNPVKQNSDNTAMQCLLGLLVSFCPVSPLQKCTHTLCF